MVTKSVFGLPVETGSPVFVNARFASRALALPRDKGDLRER